MPNQARFTKITKLLPVPRPLIKLAFGTFCFLIYLSPLPFPLSQTYAQVQSIDVSSLYQISETEAVDGDILTYTDKGIVRAGVAYTNKMFGVLQDNPLLVYRTLDSTGKPVVRSGVAQVNVTASGGEIKAGDYVTTSSNAGKGQKATVSGYVLGIALEPLSGNEGKIPVAVRIEYAELTNTKSVLRLLDAFNIAAFQSSQDPEKASQFVKYLSAGLIVLGSLILSFLIFARSILKSIEAIGRNPLAKGAIQFSIVIQAALTIITILIGVGASYIILRL